VPLKNPRGAGPPRPAWLNGPPVQISDCMGAALRGRRGGEMRGANPATIHRWPRADGPVSRAGQRQRCRLGVLCVRSGPSARRLRAGSGRCLLRCHTSPFPYLVFGGGRGGGARRRPAGMRWCVPGACVRRCGAGERPKSLVRWPTVGDVGHSRGSHARPAGVAPNVTGE